MLWTPKGNRIVKPSLAECHGLGLGLGFGGGGASAGFAPSALTGVLAWFRADLGVTNVSGKASAWANQIAGDSNTNLAQGTAGLRPTISASDALYNNQAVLVGGATIFMASGTWAAPLAQPFTWFAIGNDSGGSGSQYFIEGNISGANRSILGVEVLSGAYSTYSGSQLVAGTRTSAPRMIGGSNDNAGTSSVFVDSMTASATVGAGGIGGNGITALTAMASYAGTANLDKLAEIIICSGAMSAPDRALLRSYFNARYAMSITA